MAEINATTHLAANAKGYTEEAFTQSLDQLVKKKLKEAVKGIKKKMDETPSPEGVQLAEPFSRQPMSRLQALNLMSAGQHHSDLQKSGPGRLELHNMDEVSARALRRNVGLEQPAKSHHPVANRQDVDVIMARHSGDHLTGTMPRSDAYRLSQVDRVTAQNTLHRRGSEQTLISDSLTRERLLQVEQEGISFGHQLDESARSDVDKTPLLFTTGEHARVNVGEKWGGNGHLAKVETPLPQQRPEFQSTKMMDAAPAESTEGSKLTYRFSEWGGGHQVNVQLGAQHRTPHILQPSDTLVHQRLANYDGQSQGDWVFSDDQEQSGKRRQQSDEGME